MPGGIDVARPSRNDPGIRDGRAAACAGAAGIPDSRSAESRPASAGTPGTDREADPARGAAPAGRAVEPRFERFPSCRAIPLARRHGVDSSPAGVHASLARPPDTEHRHQAFAGGAAVASQAPPANLDWQADLRGIGKPPFARGGGGTRGDAAAREPVKPAQGTAAQLDRDISKAARGDCRNRYAGMGLLAIPMLAADAMNQSGCRW